MNRIRFFETFRTCETERAPNAKQNNDFFLEILLIICLDFDGVDNRGPATREF
jgi:hypothetical protein